MTSPMIRKYFTWILCASLTAGISMDDAASSSGSVASPPNIIIIVTDTHRADFLGCYGFEGDISPNVDALARSSVVFRNAVATAPWTKPSIASLFTSLLPRTHRVVDHHGKFWRKVNEGLKSSSLPAAAITLAEVMKAHGYTTVGWSANGWITPSLGFDQGFDIFDTPKENATRREAELILKPAVNWLRKRKPSDPPFLLYMHFMDVHGPWRWRGEDYEAIKNSPTLSRHLTKQTLERRWTPNLGRQIKPPPEDRSLPSWRAVYGAAVRAYDRQLGLFIQELKSLGLLDRSMLIITADHGEELMDNGSWGHGRKLNEHQLWVPLIVRPPGGIEEGRQEETVVSLLDLMPTILAVAGVTKPPPTMQGKSLLPMIAGVRSSDKTDDRVEGIAFAGGVKHEPGTISVRKGNLKMIWRPDLDAKRRFQLFDLAQDPTEQENLAESKPAILAELKKIAEAKLELLDRTPTLLEEEQILSPEEIEKLKSLGYIN